LFIAQVKHNTAGNLKQHETGRRCLSLLQAMSCVAATV